MASKHERCIVHVDAIATIASLWQFFDNCSNGRQSQQSLLLSVVWAVLCTATAAGAVISYNTPV